MATTKRAKRSGKRARAVGRGKVAVKSKAKPKAKGARVSRGVKVPGPTAAHLAVHMAGRRAMGIIEDSPSPPTSPLRKMRRETEGRAADTLAADGVHLPAYTIVAVPISEIRDETRGGRGAPTEADQAALRELADSIDRTDLLQLVAVNRVKGRYEQIFGSRRRQAHELLGRKTILSRVYEDLTPGQVESLRAIENVQRKDWDMAEQAEWVARRLGQVKADDAGNTSLAARCRFIGAEINKSESWVLDRSYLARLDGKARDLVKCGRLPLQQAREIATLADPALRNRLAEMAARDADMSGGMSYERVAKYCREHRHSLKVVPWRLDAEFAGAPACAACPSNTANDVDLFSHDQAESKDVESGPALCMNEACFERKRAATERSIAAGVAKVKAEHKKGKGEAKMPITATAIEAAGLMPAIVKPATFVRKAQAEVLPQQQSKRAAGGGASDDGADLPGGGPNRKESAKELAMRRAGEEFDREHAQWFEKLRAAVYGKLAQVPGAMVVLGFLVCASQRIADVTPSWQGSDAEAKSVKTLASPDIRALLAAAVKGDVSGVRELETELAAALGEGEYGGKAICGVVCEQVYESVNTPFLCVLGEFAGAEISPRPMKADFEKKALANLPAEAEPAAKK